MLARQTAPRSEATMRSVKLQPVSVLVVDDLTSFRRAAAAVVGVADGFELAGEADSGEAAIAFLERQAVNLVLMDVSMPGIGGIRAATDICRRFPDVVVVLLSVHQVQELPGELRSSGTPFVHKERFGPDLLDELWAGHGPGGTG